MNPRFTSVDPTEDAGLAPSVSTGDAPAAPKQRRPAGPWALFGLALVQPASVVWARWDWRGDIFDHLQEPAAALSIIAAIALRRRARWLSAGLLLLAAVQLWPLIRYHGPNPAPADPASPHRLRILISNVHHKNTNHDLLINLIRRERPDVVGLVEFEEHWSRAIADAGLREEYPHFAEHPAGARGLAIYSRRPFYQGARLETPLDGGSPLYAATIEFAGKRVNFYLVHPPNPLSALGRGRYNPETDALTARIARDGGSRIVAGDFNRTEASPRFGKFLEQTGLRDSRFGFGRQASWPTNLPITIAIDHAFLSADLAIVERRLGPKIGSDHYPLIFTVAPAAVERNASAQASHD